MRLVHTVASILALKACICIGRGVKDTLIRGWLGFRSTQEIRAIVMLGLEGYIQEPYGLVRCWTGGSLELMTSLSSLYHHSIALLLESDAYMEK